MPKTSKTAQMTNMRSLILLLMALLSPALAQAQGTLTPTPQITFLDASGNPISNGKICTYAAGTTTPQATYFNPDLDSSHVNANPIRTDSAGRPTTGGIYLSASSYKFLILTAGTDGTCATGTTVYSQDNVAAVPATAVALDVTGTAGTTIAAGNVVYLANGTGGTTTGRWYLSDADNTYSSSSASIVGIATTAIATGSSGAIRVGGRMTGLSSLTAGSDYYASATDGTLTAVAPTNARFVGRADTTTTLIIAPNPAPTITPLSIAEGRLTCTTATPVTTADCNGVASIFYTPYKGNRIALFDGTAVWNVRLFTEIAVSVAACTASKPFDVFLFDNAGVVTAETLVWTNTTTRATALTLQNGVLVKTGATTRRYVGSFFCNASGGQTDDSAAKRNVWNYYNRVRRSMLVNESTNTWTYTTATWRQANASTANQLEVMIGAAEESISVSLISSMASDTAGVATQISIGEDSTTTPATEAQYGRVTTPVNNYQSTQMAVLRKIPAVGRHLYTWLEFSAAVGTTTWYGDDSAGTVRQSGISGDIAQ